MDEENPGLIFFFSLPHCQQRNGVLVEMGVRYALEESRLKVIDTRSSDSGIYVCVATNEAGTDQQAFTLEVLIPPKMIAETRNELAVAQGDNATLRCQSRGYPAPQIIWSIEWPDQQVFWGRGNLIDTFWRESTCKRKK